MVRRSRIGGEVETQTYKFDDTGKENFDAAFGASRQLGICSLP